MSRTSSRLTRGLFVTLATGAMALAAASPAQAQYRGQNYDRGGRDVVDQCVRAAERSVGRGQVTQVSNVARYRDGYRVYGSIGVAQQRGEWRGRDRHDDRRDQRWGGDRYRDQQTARFSCIVSRGRVVDLDVAGNRGGRSRF